MAVKAVAWADVVAWADAKVAWADAKVARGVMVDAEAGDDNKHYDGSDHDNVHDSAHVYNGLADNAWADAAVAPG